tara:strand:- start:1371 stop:1685 length:315 start_codon:yes stop_codon:yes gene_type:complete
MFGTDVKKIDFLFEGRSIAKMESISKMMGWAFDISKSIPEQYYIELMNYLKDVHEEIEQSEPSGPKRCKAIKWNNNRCRQEGQSNQSGGEIIDGYCNYHKSHRS